jgi:hypothetical protein
VIAQIFRFRSRLPEPEVRATYGSRIQRYRETPGLLQKIYLAFEDGQHGAVYLWDSMKSLERFRASDLARSIPAAYHVEGAPDVELADVAMVLHPELQRAPS